jgi:hypothetical protein
VKARTRSLVTALALLGAAAGALALAWWGVDRRGEAEAARRQREERLFAFEPAEVKDLTVEATAGTTRLVRGEKGFRIPALDAAADAAAVESILELFAHLRRKAVVAPPGADARALAGYGLARPRIRLRASLADGRTETLELGDRSEFDGSVYVRPTSGAVILAPGQIDWWLDKGPAELREKPRPEPAAPAEPAPDTAKPGGKQGS